MPPARNQGGRDDLGSLSDLEELDPQAILAHETAAHAPQKRAQVVDEARSVVISDPQPPSSQPVQRAPLPQRSPRAEPTLQLRDRSDLDAARRRILANRRKQGLSRNAVWFGFALAAFALGGAVALLSLRSRGPAVQAAGVSAAFPRPSASAAPASVPSVRIDQLPQQVQLEELPVERPKRHVHAEHPTDAE